MIPFLESSYANPSSVHAFGQAVRHRIECARQQVAELIGATPKEIIFTSGGTESINLAIRGTLALHPQRRHVVTSAVEHSAVMRLSEQLQTEGYEVDYVGVDDEGRLDEDEWTSRITERTALVSLIHANNETGVLLDVARLCSIASERGVPVHIDAVQSAGKLDIDVTQWGAQLVSLSAHKFHGPKGVGALYVRRRSGLVPQIRGGQQERSLRGGTEHVAGIVGMGVAAEIAATERSTFTARIRALRDELEAGLTERIPIATVNGRGSPRIHNTSNISFAGLSGEAILLLLSEAGVCASSGAACSSGSVEPSHVLDAMGLDAKRVHSAVRFSLSRFTTRDEIQFVVNKMPVLLSKLTTLSV